MLGVGARPACLPACLTACLPTSCHFFCLPLHLRLHSRGGTPACLSAWLQLQPSPPPGNACPACRMGGNGQLGGGVVVPDTLPEPEPVPMPVEVLGNHAFVEVAAGNSFTFARTAAGEGYCWG